EARKRRERAHAWIELGEEQLVEHQRGGGAVDEEVVPFERRADGGRQHHAASRMICRGQRMRRSLRQSCFLSPFSLWLLMISGCKCPEPEVRARLPRIRLRTSGSKGALEHNLTSVPLIPKFA